MVNISLSSLFATRACGNYNKDVVFLLVGERGSGKSMSALYIAHKTAVEIAKRKGGTWQDYFSMDNVSIIDPADLLQKLTHIKKYGVYVLDDAGAGWGARSFMSAQNQLLNRILQTVRTQNAVLIITTIDPAHIDVQVRGMSSFYGEVAECHHNLGYSYLKIFRQDKLNRAKKSIYSHLTFHNDDGTSAKIVRWVTRMPPKELVDQYNALRTSNALELMREFEKEKDEIIPKSPNKWESMVAKYGPSILEMHQSKKTLQEIAHDTGLSEYYVRRLKTTVGAF